MLFCSAGSLVVAQCPASSNDQSGGSGAVFNYDLTAGTPTCIDLGNSITIGSTTYVKNTCIDSDLANYVISTGSPETLPNTVDFGGSIGSCAYDASGNIRVVDCPNDADDGGSGGAVYTFDIAQTNSPLCSDLPMNITIGGQPYTRTNCMDGTIAQYSLTAAPGLLPATIDFGGVVGSCAYEAGGALPIDLVAFQAIEKQGAIELSWQTASEKNNLGFEIERSRNAFDWQVLDFIEGHGTTDAFQHYTYTDQRPRAGYNYYRLKQIDFDGSFEFSEIRSVYQEIEAGHTIEVFPNPSDGRFTLRLHNPKEKKAFLKLLDSTGNLIWQQDFRNEGIQILWEKEFNLPQYEVYFLVTQIGEIVETQKVVIIDKK